MITLELWSIENVLGDVCLSGRVLEDATGRYKKYDYIVSKPLMTIYFNSPDTLAYDTALVEYKLFGNMRKK